MPKYWGKQIFTHGRFPEVGQKQKTERKEEERLNYGLLVALSSPWVDYVHGLGPVDPVRVVLNLERDDVEPPQPPTTL